MRKTILGGLTFLAWATMTAGTFAQETPRLFEIACAHSKITVPDGLRCQTTQNYSGFPNSADSDPGGTFRNWLASGTINGAQYLYIMTEVTSMNVGLNPNGTLHDTIKAEVALAKATNFSALANRGGADLMTFNIAAGNSRSERAHV